MLGGYRALLDASKGDPRLAATRQEMDATIGVPTLALCGAAEVSRLGR